MWHQNLETEALERVHPFVESGRSIARRVLRHLNRWKWKIEPYAL